MKKKLLYFFIFSNMFFMYCWPDTIMIVASKNTPYTRDIISGISVGLSESSPDTNIETIYVEDTSPAEALKIQNYSAVCVIGLRAAKASRNLSNIPIIFALMPENSIENSLGPANNINATGTFISADPQQQIMLLKKILPENETVYMLYSQNSQAIHDMFVKGNLGVNFETKKITAPQEVPVKINSLVMKIKSSFLILPDNSIFDMDALAYVINFGITKQVPIIGFSSIIVKTGALLGYTFDYKNIGVQTSEIIDKVLAGASPKDIPRERVKKIGYALNLKTAQALGISLSPATIKGAAEVIN